MIDTKLITRLTVKGFEVEVIQSMLIDYNGPGYRVLFRHVFSCRQEYLKQAEAELHLCLAAPSINEKARLLAKFQKEVKRRAAEEKRGALPRHAIYIKDYAGQSSRVMRLGTGFGETFEDACIEWAVRTDKGQLYNREKNTYWGCRLFPTLEEAKGTK